jgi:hypothetical protein
MYVLSLAVRKMRILYFNNWINCEKYYFFQMGVIWLYPVPILFDRFSSYVEPVTTPYVLPLTQMALTGTGYELVLSI